MEENQGPKAVKFILQITMQDQMHNDPWHTKFNNFYSLKFCGAIGDKHFL